MHIALCLGFAHKSMGNIDFHVDVFTFVVSLWLEERKLSGTTDCRKREGWVGQREKILSSIYPIPRHPLLYK